MVSIKAPVERTCERCGRRDRWDPEQEAWTVRVTEDGTRQSGTPYCLHDWDINGSYNPLSGTY
jgi:hypothetical protein